MSASPATGSAIHFISAASADTATSNPNGPGDFDLSELPAQISGAVQSDNFRSINRTLNLGAHLLHGSHARDLRSRDAEASRNTNRVLHENDLLLETGRHIDRRVCDNKHFMVFRDFENGDVTDEPTFINKSVLTVENRTREVGRLHESLHEYVGFSRGSEFGGGGACSNRILFRNELGRPDRDSAGVGRSFDFRAVTYQDEVRDRLAAAFGDAANNLFVFRHRNRNYPPRRPSAVGLVVGGMGSVGALEAGTLAKQTFETCDPFHSRHLLQ